MKRYVNLCTFLGKGKGKRTSTVSETKWLFKEKITLIRLPEKKHHPDPTLKKTITNWPHERIKLQRKEKKRKQKDNITHQQLSKIKIRPSR